MASEFGVKIKETKGISFSSVYKTLESGNQSIKNVSGALRDNSYAGIRTVLAKVTESNTTYVSSVKQLESVLDLIAEQYEKTENDILGKKTERAKNVERDDGGHHIEDEDAWDYIADALKQAILGDWTEDSNGLGTTLSVLMGFVPILGQACDIRDLVANVKDLIKDGPETKEWVELGFTLIGAIPGIGDFCKHGDEVGDLLKGLGKNGDAIGDAVKGVLKKGEDVYSAVGKYVDDFNKFIDEEILKDVKIDDIVNDAIENITKKIPDNKVMDLVKSIGNKEINILWENNNIAEMTKEWGKEFMEYIGADYLGIDVQDWITTGIDKIIGENKEETGGKLAYNYRFAA